MNDAGSNQLCLECGLCCNGVLFADGQLQPEDDGARLQALGLALVKNRNPKSQSRKFQQPCGGFDGCRCRIYAERPKYCREFECALLKKVKSARTGPDAALKIIRAARRRANRVLRLLRELGDSDETLPLSLRFRRTQRRIESGVLNNGTADRFGELTLAVQDLNFMLSRKFYPGGK